MRFTTSFSVLCAALSVAPVALAMPMDFEAADGLEVRAFEGDVEAGLLARADEPPRYHRNDPNNGKKPPYTPKDPNPPPKYRQKDPNVPNRDRLERNGGSSRGHGSSSGHRRDLSDLYVRADEPPRYHRNDPNNGKKPPYTPKDPNPPPKYRQKDPNVPNRDKLERNGGPSRGHGNGRRELDALEELLARESLYGREFDLEDSLWAREDMEDLWAREVEEVLARADEPPRYHRNDPINGKKPPYTPKDPNPPPKYRQKDPNVPNRDRLERNGGPSRGHGNGRRELSFWS
ncbi:hypothetical protein C8Q72DRAFT_881038 [Fomitopsis betulina]|nr:hypothetical protein C8Q72DRAFT_881038 [Fomitopsis betulina]